MAVLDKIIEALEPGDRKKIADIAGCSKAHITNILNGKSKMTQKVRSAIVEVIREKEEFVKELDELLNKS